MSTPRNKSFEINESLGFMPSLTSSPQRFVPPLSDNSHILFSSESFSTEFCPTPSKNHLKLMSHWEFMLSLTSSPQRFAKPLSDNSHIPFSAKSLIPWDLGGPILVGPPELHERPGLCHVAQHLFVGCSGVMVGLGLRVVFGGRWEVIIEEGEPIWLPPIAIRASCIKNIHLIDIFPPRQGTPLIWN